MQEDLSLAREGRQYIDINQYGPGEGFRQDRSRHDHAIKPGKGAVRPPPEKKVPARGSPDRALFFPAPRKSYAGSSKSPRAILAAMSPWSASVGGGETTWRIIMSVFAFTPRATLRGTTTRSPSLTERRFSPATTSPSPDTM